MGRVCMGCFLCGLIMAFCEWNLVICLQTTRLAVSNKKVYDRPHARSVKSHAATSTGLMEYIVKQGLLTSDPIKLDEVSSPQVLRESLVQGSMAFKRTSKEGNQGRPPELTDMVNTQQAVQGSMHFSVSHPGQMEQFSIRPKQVDVHNTGMDGNEEFGSLDKGQPHLPSSQYQQDSHRDVASSTVLSDSLVHGLGPFKRKPKIFDVVNVPPAAHGNMLVSVNDPASSQLSNVVNTHIAMPKSQQTTSVSGPMEQFAISPKRFPQQQVYDRAVANASPHQVVQPPVLTKNELFQGFGKRPSQQLSQSHHRRQYKQFLPRSSIPYQDQEWLERQRRKLYLRNLEKRQHKKILPRSSIPDQDQEWLNRQRQKLHLRNLEKRQHKKFLPRPSIANQDKAWLESQRQKLHLRNLEKRQRKKFLPRPSITDQDKKWLEIQRQKLHLRNLEKQHQEEAQRHQTPKLAKQQEQQNHHEQQIHQHIPQQRQQHTNSAFHVGQHMLNEPAGRASIYRSFGTALPSDSSRSASLPDTESPPSLYGPGTPSTLPVMGSPSPLPGIGVPYSLSSRREPSSLPVSESLHAWPEPGGPPTMLPPSLSDTFGSASADQSLATTERQLWNLPKSTLAQVPRTVIQETSQRSGHTVVTTPSKPMSQTVPAQPVIHLYININRSPGPGQSGLPSQHIEYQQVGHHGPESGDHLVRSGQQSNPRYIDQSRMLPPIASQVDLNAIHNITRAVVDSLGLPRQSGSSPVIQTAQQRFAGHQQPVSQNIRHLGQNVARNQQPTFQNARSQTMNNLNQQSVDPWAADVRQFTPNTGGESTVNQHPQEYSNRISGSFPTNSAMRSSRLHPNGGYHPNMFMDSQIASGQHDTSSQSHVQLGRSVNLHNTGVSHIRPSAKASSSTQSAWGRIELPLLSDQQFGYEIPQELLQEHEKISGNILTMNSQANMATSAVYHEPPNNQRASSRLYLTSENFLNDQFIPSDHGRQQTPISANRGSVRRTQTTANPRGTPQSIGQYRQKSGSNVNSNSSPSRRYRPTAVHKSLLPWEEPWSLNGHKNVGAKSSITKPLYLTHYKKVRNRERNPQVRNRKTSRNTASRLPISEWISPFAENSSISSNPWWTIENKAPKPSETSPDRLASVSNPQHSRKSLQSQQTRPASKTASTPGNIPQTEQLVVSLPSQQTSQVNRTIYKSKSPTHKPSPSPTDKPSPSPSPHQGENNNSVRTNHQSEAPVQQMNPRRLGQRGIVNTKKWSTPTRTAVTSIDQQPGRLMPKDKNVPASSSILVHFNSPIHTVQRGSSSHTSNISPTMHEINISPISPTHTETLPNHQTIPRMGSLSSQHKKTPTGQPRTKDVSKIIGPSSASGRFQSIAALQNLRQNSLTSVQQQMSNNIQISKLTRQNFSTQTGNASALSLAGDHRIGWNDQRQEMNISQMAEAILKNPGPSGQRGSANLHNRISSLRSITAVSSVGHQDSKSRQHNTLKPSSISGQRNSPIPSVQTGHFNSRQHNTPKSSSISVRRNRPIPSVQARHLMSRQHNTLRSSSISGQRTTPLPSVQTGHFKSRQDTALMPSSISGQRNSPISSVQARHLMSREHTALKPSSISGQRTTPLPSVQTGHFKSRQDTALRPSSISRQRNSPITSVQARHFKSREHTALKPSSISGQRNSPIPSVQARHFKSRQHTALKSSSISVQRNSPIQSVQPRHFHSRQHNALKSSSMSAQHTTTIPSVQTERALRTSYNYPIMQESHVSPPTKTWISYNYPIIQEMGSWRSSLPNQKGRSGPTLSRHQNKQQRLSSLSSQKRRSGSTLSRHQNKQQRRNSLSSQKRRSGSTLSRHKNEPLHNNAIATSSRNIFDMFKGGVSRVTNIFNPKRTRFGGKRYVRKYFGSLTSKPMTLNVL